MPERRSGPAAATLAGKEMPPPKSTRPAAARPRFSAHFDAWNSSSTGHQRAENALGHSTGWRQSRNLKLSYQFKSGVTGGHRISDQVGVGSKDWEEKAKALISNEVRESAGVRVAGRVTRERVALSSEEQLMAQRKREDDSKDGESICRKRGIFEGLVIYINGSTHPSISDHKLKHVLAENGGKMSLHLGRRQVTHVILGKPSGTLGMGAGGGLSGIKLEKEIRRVGGCGVKYVGVEWVLESLQAGRRLSETRFTNLKVAPKNQKSVYEMFKKPNSTASSGSEF
ncbi:BRCA1 C Terminus (BRCT) domain containing protein [Marssonina coronariae]|uniref:BRCA1 C Terminus (BRCT) domain containing protein n=1 Tax=Diplocarpon coronariae TaxID=2795749 RepID=A0A218ZH46_9HELO|nr:BRCA1 C Terminus (BRCT) domain containing protein [Marssonina coronariae]